MDENQNESVNLNSAQIDSAAPPSANSQENPKQISDNPTEEKSPKKKKKALKITLISIAAVIIIVAAAFGIWRSQQLVMPDVISKSVSAAYKDITNLQDPTDEDKTARIKLVDENGKNLFNRFGAIPDEISEKYEVYDTTPAAGELFGKDETVTLYAQKNAATIKAEREKAGVKLIKKWHKRFRAQNGSCDVKDYNCFLFTFKMKEKAAHSSWRMEQQEQDTIDLFAEQQKCNVLLFIYSSDGYIIAAYNAFYSQSSDSDTNSFVKLASKKISAAKSVTKSKKSIRKYATAVMKYQAQGGGTEAIFWGKDGNYITLTKKLKSGLYLTDGNGGTASKNELREYYDFDAKQISYLLKCDFEYIFIQDEFTIKKKVKYKGIFYAHNDKFNSLNSKTLQNKRGFRSN